MNLNLDLNNLIGTVFVSVFVLFIIYRRFRRNFGRQPLRPKRMIFRMALLCVVGALLLIPTLFSTELALITVVGLGIGVGLALWAAKHTRFLKQDGVLYYIPHTYTGIVVSALFLGRIIYRFVVLSSSAVSIARMESQGSSTGDFGGLQAITHNPVTRVIFFILIGYYVYYYWYVLHESKHMKPEDWETSPPA